MEGGKHGYLSLSEPLFNEIRPSTQYATAKSDKERFVKGPDIVEETREGNA